MCGWDRNSPSKFVTLWKRIKFCISSFSSSPLMTSFALEKFSFCESWIPLHELNFPYFSVSYAIQTQILHLDLWHFERQLNSASSPFLLLLWQWTFQTKNFNFMKGEFVCKNEIFLNFQLLLPFSPKFYIWIYDSLKEN